jgi:hypothetical protein
VRGSPLSSPKRLNGPLMFVLRAEIAGIPRIVNPGMGTCDGARCVSYLALMIAP